ncbi:MAG: hypothetical protein LC689_18015 [Myxococcales bacterium]|nr:hypothetical protein [Myxococcales bacterium]
MLVFATAGLAAQSDKQGKDSLQLPVTSAAGTFSGTFSINRFEVRNNAVFAIGVVRGSLAGTGSTVAGEVAAPVTVGAASAAAGVSNAAVAQQQATTCQVLHLDVGAINLNIQGLIVATQPISIDLSGDSSAPLGNLVCTIESTLNNVVGLVGLLNQLLGVLSGLVGGVTGGLGG